MKKGKKRMREYEKEMVQSRILKTFFMVLRFMFCGQVQRARLRWLSLGIAFIVAAVKTHQVRRVVLSVFSRRLIDNGATQEDG
jgi:small-conductance mechanosensitive channel